MTATATTPLPMTRGRRIALAIGVPIAFAVIGWTAFTLVSWVGQDSYPVRQSAQPRGGHLWVAMSPGHLTLRPSTDGRIHLAGTSHYSLIRPERPAWHPVPGGLRVSTRCPVPTGPGCAFDYTITVPATLAVSAAGDSGLLTASGLRHGLRLSADSAGLRVSDVAGPVRLSTDSGTITASGLAAPQVTARSDSGGVFLEFTKIPASVQVATDSGSVTVVVPRGPTHYRVRVSTDSGGRHVGVPTDSASGHVITVTTDSGSVTIRHPG